MEYPHWILWDFGSYRRKFRSQTSHNMQRWKSRGAKSQGGEEKKWEDQRRARRKKMQMRKKVGKSRFTVFLQWFVAQEGRKVGSLKRRVRSQLARCGMKNGTPLWREARFEVKMYKTLQHRTTFEVEMSKMLWHEAHFQVNSVKKLSHPGPLLEVEMSKEECTALWREAHLEVKSVKKIRGADHFWTFRCRFAWQGNVNLVKSEQDIMVLWQLQLQLQYITLHYIILGCTALHYTTLHYPPLHYTTLHYTTLPYTTPHYTTLYTTLHYITLHYTSYSTIH